MEIRVALRGQKKVSGHFDGFEVMTDQPISAGGEGSAPSPFDLFLASIATCAGFFAQSYCQTRQLPSDGIAIVQTMVRDPQTRLVTQIVLRVTVPSSFPSEHHDGLIAAINACSVKKHLLHPPNISVEIQS